MRGSESPTSKRSHVGHVFGTDGFRYSPDKVGYGYGELLAQFIPHLADTKEPL